MITIRPPFRWATAADAAALATLVNIAGEGMPLYLWQSMAENGQSPWEIGKQRAVRETGGFSFRNSVVRESDGKVAALLVGYPLAADAEAVSYDQLPPMFVPLQQLEDLAPGTWYVNVLATLPEFRGRGFGSELMTIAEQRAADSGCSGMSLIVSDANIDARRLYERLGYSEQASRPMVKEQWENRGEHWVLLVKAF